jgi:hypothetical protein
MANPRLPAQKAEVSGATLKNAGRHAGRKAPRTRPIGEPFARMTNDQRQAWDQFRDELPWLNNSHRALLEIACNVRARLASGDEVGINVLQTYSAILSKLAATPVDETRISANSAEDEDPADRFFGRPN